MKKIISIALVFAMLLTCVSLAASAADVTYDVKFDSYCHVVWTENAGDDAVYAPGEVCRFTCKAADGYEKTYGFTVLVNKVPVTPDENGVYSFTVNGDAYVTVLDGSIMEHNTFGVIEIFTYWIKFILTFFRNLFDL